MLLPAGVAASVVSTGTAGAASSDWTLQTTPNPNPTTNPDNLNAVSCVTASLCQAVGEYQSGAPVAESWNGSTWSIQPIATPSGAARTDLDALSCASAASCIAVGNFSGAAGNGAPTAESWNGSTWTVLTVPASSVGTNTDLDGVSCTSASSCVAVGHVALPANPNGLVPVGSAPVAEGWNGTAWSIQNVVVPTGEDISILSGVSCPSPGTCEAVGSESVFSGTTAPLAEALNGTTWTAQAVPVPSGASFTGLSGVSCTAANACQAVGGAAVGNQGTNPLNDSLVASWNGLAWSTQTLPNQSGQQVSSLNSISCTTSSSCEAVGSQATQGNSFGLASTLAENWNGLAWTIDPTPNGDISNLISVSCAPSCETIGQQTNTQPFPPPVTQMAEGKTTPLATPPPPSSGSSGLTGLLGQLLGLVTGLLSLL